MKVLLDSNIIIYLGTDKAEIIEKFLFDKILHVSIISKIETFGYHKITDKEKKFLNLIFDKVKVISLDDNIIETAIHLKQKQKITLGDSLIAASALEHKLTLITNNTDDFEGIKGLKLLNPFK